MGDSFTIGDLKPAMYEKLFSDGWKEFPDALKKSGHSFYKRFDTPTRCACNNDKDGIQVCVLAYDRDGIESYGVEIIGQLPDGTWINLHNYAMSIDIDTCLAAIPRLLETWEFICARNSKVKPIDDPNSLLGEKRNG